MFAGKKSAQIREILISESAWEEMTCLFAPSIAADLAAGAVLLEVAAHPAAGNSTIKNASPEAGIFKSDKVSLMPGL